MRDVSEQLHQSGKGEDADWKAFQKAASHPKLPIQLEKTGGGGASEGSLRRMDVGGVEERTATRERRQRAATIGPGDVEAGKEGGERIKIHRRSSLPDCDMAVASKAAFRAGVHGATTGALYSEDTSDRQERENASAGKRQSSSEDKEERKRAADAGKNLWLVPICL